MKITRAEGDQVLFLAGVTTVLHASRSSGSTQICVLEQTHAPGEITPTHQHRDSEETIPVLQGQGEFWAGDESVVLEAGSTILIPPHTWHGFRNVGEGPLRIIASIAGESQLVEYESDPGTAIEVGSDAWCSRWSAG